MFKCQRYPWLIIYYVYLLTKQNRKTWSLLNRAKNVLLHPIPNIVKTFQPFVCVFHASPLMPNWTSWSFQPTWHRPQATADPLPRKGRRAPSALQRHRFGNSSRPVGLGEKQLRHGAQGLKISEIIGNLNNPNIKKSWFCESRTCHFLLFVCVCAFVPSGFHHYISTKYCRPRMTKVLWKGASVACICNCP